MIGVDLFAGLGGMSVAARAAGHTIALAADHWPAAVAAHAFNHPETEHWTQDLQQADWSRVPRHQLLLASPSCQGHCDARGVERPHHDAARSTAWAVVSCAEYHRPDVVLVENVPEMRKWALYPAWKMAMAALGYALAEHVLDAADHGVPQHREAGGRWRPVDVPGRSAATLARVAAGRRAFGDRFVAPYYGTGSGLTGRSIDRPLGTVTTRDRWSVVDGRTMRMLGLGEYTAAMGFPAAYEVPSRPKALGVHLLGNAVCPPVVTDLLEALEAA